MNEKIKKNCRKLREVFDWESDDIDYGIYLSCCVDARKYLTFTHKIHPSAKDDNWVGPGFYYGIETFSWRRVGAEQRIMRYCPFCGEKISAIKERPLNLITESKEQIAKRRRDEMDRRHPIK